MLLKLLKLAGALLIGVALAATDIPVPRHAMSPVGFGPYGAKTDPSPFANISGNASIATKAMDQMWKEYSQSMTAALPDITAPNSGLTYFNTVVGQNMGPKTIKGTADAANFLDKAMKGLVDTTDEVNSAVNKMKVWAVAKTEMVTEWLDNLHPPIFIPSESMANAKNVFEMYKALRSIQMMVKAWRQQGPLVKIDLLDILPVYDILTPNGGDPGIRLKFAYRDHENPQSIYAAMGITNPFIGSWVATRMTYKGPRNFSDLSVKIEASPYVQRDGSDASQSSAAAELENLTKNLNRFFHEGTMGAANANLGLRLNTNGVSANRPSPMFLQARAESIANQRLDQIYREKVELSKLGVPPSKLSEKYDSETSFWTNWPTNLKESQTMRINRIRGELQTVDAETTKAEAGKKLINEDQLMGEGGGFLDKLYNTYKFIAGSMSDLYSAITDKEDPEKSGPRIVYKANVQYALATFDAYHEAVALRKILYARLKAQKQQQAAKPILDMQEKFKARLGYAEGSDAAVDNFIAQAEELMDILREMGFEDPQAVIQEIADEVARRRALVYN